MPRDEDIGGSTLKEEDRKTSHDHATGGRFPGDFVVQSIFLTSPSFKDPEKIEDLSAVWTEINLFEDIIVLLYLGMLHWFHREVLLKVFRL